MARTQGALHSDKATGTLGSITHRTYRGVGVASSKRIPRSLAPQLSHITNPNQITGLIVRWDLGQLVKTYKDNGTYRLESVNDLIGGRGLLEQLAASKMPAWFPSDPDHNSQPYLLTDGIDDFMETPALPDYIPQPLEFWMVMADLVPPTLVRYYWSTYDGANSHFGSYSVPGSEYRLAFCDTQYIGHTRAVGLHVWRIVVNGPNSFLEIDGVQQKPPLNVGTCRLGKFVLGCRYDETAHAAFKLFELDIFNTILTPIQCALLRSWFHLEYDT